jgi:hypothetical protein
VNGIDRLGESSGFGSFIAAVKPGDGELSDALDTRKWCDAPPVNISGALRYPQGALWIEDRQASPRCSPMHARPYPYPGVGPPSENPNTG